MKYLPYTERQTPDGPSYRLDPKFKVAWVEALLSGDYLQGEGYLRNTSSMLDGPDRYCCLGVACVIGDIPHFSSNQVMVVPGLDGRSNSISYIPWDYHLIPSDVQRGLALLNDEGIPFELLAGFIQENL